LERSWRQGTVVIDNEEDGEAGSRSGAVSLDLSMGFILAAVPS
jgi:hypothetical protein